ncbi:MAG: LysR family transcriptional regulator [Oscillospiraceae bacterium]
MEIRVLKYFITVAQEENMTRAAEVLHTTQSNLSRQLAELENSVGKKLFERGSRKITLTFGAACFSGRYRADSSSENTAPETL